MKPVKFLLKAERIKWFFPLFSLGLNVVTFFALFLLFPPVLKVVNKGEVAFGLLLLFFLWVYLVIYAVFSAWYFYDQTKDKRILNGLWLPVILAILFWVFFRINLP